MPEEKKPRGFAALSPEELRRISRRGGKASHAAGVAHEFTSKEARRAGHLGGKAKARAKAEEKEKEAS